MTYRIEEIASVINGEFMAKHDNALITEMLMDSRRVVSPAGSLFFALRGPRRDGHAFVIAAHRKGIRNFVLSEKPAADLPDSNIILVRDTMSALHSLAAFHRSRFDIPVVGITGSNGKTIVKEWLNQLLSDRFKIVRSPKSYNSQTGVPLSIWQINESAGLAILEAGISQPGEMEKLELMIRPSIGLFTNIGDAHAAGFTGIRQKVREKLKLFYNVKTLVYCRDHKDIAEEVDRLKYELETSSRPVFKELTWSMATDADLVIRSVKKTGDGTMVAGMYKGTEHHIFIPFTDSASLENAINCWCVLLLLQLPPEVVYTKMKSLHPIAMRLEMKSGINHTSIINDSYSADLSSLGIALDFLAGQKQHTKRTVILTDFMESGRPERELYRGIAASLAGHEVTRLIGVGPVISENSDVFEKDPSGLYHGIAERFFFPSVEAFLEAFPGMTFGNEIILIKGARIFELERINKLLETQTHQTRLEISLDALADNLKVYQQQLHPATRVMAMVKAFSYGSGSHQIASVLQFNQVDYLAVAYIDEGVDLRKNGITLPIMVMNPDTPSFGALVNHNLEPDIYSPGIAASFANFLNDEGLHNYPVHLELETGMNRLGFSENELDSLLTLLDTSSLRVQSVFSHLAGSEDPSLDAFTREQASLFSRMSDRIAERLAYPFIRHILNTSGITRHASLQFDMVRIGIGLYGVDAAKSANLTEVSTLKTAVAQVKMLGPGDSVSYGRSGKVDKPTTIATVRIGFADGYPRSLGNGRGKMMINNTLVPTIGNVCMDMTMLDVTGAGVVEEGQEVLVFGNGLSVAQVAQWAGTIPYEILAGVSQRVKRVYFKE